MLWSLLVIYSTNSTGTSDKKILRTCHNQRSEAGASLAHSAKSTIDLSILTVRRLLGLCLWNSSSRLFNGEDTQTIFFSILTQN
jgi:hypothetical protein